MKLNLTKPLIVFDLEATGLDLVRDRIIQISFTPTERKSAIIFSSIPNARFQKSLPN